MLVSLIVTIVPTGLLLIRGADRVLPLPNLRAIAATRTSRSHAVLLIFLLSGAAGLIYEVVWARQLVLVFGNTTQAMSAILTGYFGGIAIGSVLGGRIADRVRSPLRLYGLIELLLVVVVLMTPLLFRGIHELYRSCYPSFESAPDRACPLPLRARPPGPRPGDRADGRDAADAVAPSAARARDLSVTSAASTR